MSNHPIFNDWRDDLEVDRKPRANKPRPPKPDPAVVTRFQQAHENYNRIKFPQAFVHSYQPAKLPAIHKANGLTQAIVKFLIWSGHRATRIASAGRMINGKWIPGTTRKGAADVSATIRGRSVMLEVKIGSDRPSEYQLREQALERQAGGVYEFIKTFEQFILWYDQFMLTL